MERIGGLLAGARDQATVATPIDTSDRDEKLSYVMAKMDALDARMTVLEREHGISPPAESYHG